MQTRQAIDAVAKACAGARACNGRFLGFTQALRGNLASAQRRPVSVHGRHEGSRIPVVLDGGTLLRAYREG